MADTKNKGVNTVYIAGTGRIANPFFSRKMMADLRDEATKEYITFYRCDWPTEPRPEPAEEDIP